MDESPAETAPVPEVSNGWADRTPEELVAKSIAPVKKQFLCPPPIRACSNEQNDAVSGGKTKPAQASVVKEKKSERQLKRERQQVVKSAVGICPEVAKIDVSRWPYNDKCRFSHDIEAYKAQKPEDIEGECPFMTAQETCPYGLACRFLGSHKYGIEAGDVSSHKRSSEMNGLVQKDDFALGFHRIINRLERYHRFEKKKKEKS